jgi:hypothetical protein
MATYRLTQEDIDRFNLADAVPGDIATEQELRMMFPAQMNELDQQARQAMTSDMFTPSGVSGSPVAAPTSTANLPYTPSEILPPDVPVSQQVTGTTQPLSNTGIEAMLAQGQPGRLAGATTREDDPYSNLSKTQRRMLAFAAISDAGAALQGKQGTMVTSLLGDFTERADQARKANAAAQRQELLSSLMGGGMGAGMSLEGFNPTQRRQAIVAAMTQGLIEPAAAKVLLDQTAQMESQISAIGKSQSMIADVDTVLQLPGLDQLLGIEGVFTRSLESLGLGALRQDAMAARAFMEKIKGGLFLQAFESLKGGGQITELEGQKATQAAARLNEAQSAPAFRDALAEVRFYADLARRRANGEPVPLDTFYESTLTQTDTPEADQELDEDVSKYFE